MFEHYDDEGFTYSTDTEWDRAEAYQLGELYPERAWIFTDRDVIHANPFYKGPPVPHPDDYHDEGDEGNRISLEEQRGQTGSPKFLDPLDDMPF